ncbi:hypothetical protein ARALYDRAFT_480402 [Arabidopsis lyrata subsp. lyrata]|uniref:Glycine-rich protein n=1 Tax=Arabidopsis lyrata subsp. lyrata TaxID=81972 RepID=D7L3L1_ARALL|nr:hypothetical protein ARALYDRAFT_480402 [Arabidopsis lyrata subsp. lyrata]
MALSGSQKKFFLLVLAIACLSSSCAEAWSWSSSNGNGWGWGSDGSSTSTSGPGSNTGDSNSGAPLGDLGDGVGDLTALAGVTGVIIKKKNSSDFHIYYNVEENCLL